MYEKQENVGRVGIVGGIGKENTGGGGLNDLFTSLLTTKIFIVGEEERGK